MKKILSVYSIAYGVLLMVVLGMLYFYPKVELHLLLNSHHTSIQDTFFKYYSMMAEGPLYILALLPLLWKKKELTIFFALCELSGGAVLQIIKHIFYSQRPASVFEHYNNLALPVVQGVDLHHSNSFPSGHASTFFVFFTCCALILAYKYQHSSKENKHHSCFLIDVVMLAFLVLAALGAYSRIYLSQHFLSDVCMGSVIGFIIPCLFFYFGRKKILKLKTNEITEK